MIVTDASKTWAAVTFQTKWFQTIFILYVCFRQSDFGRFICDSLHPSPF